jgi:hypothetical protein
MPKGWAEWHASMLSCLYRAKAHDNFAQPPLCRIVVLQMNRGWPFLSIFVQIAHLRWKILFSSLSDVIAAAMSILAPQGK